MESPDRGARRSAERGRWSRGARALPLVGLALLVAPACQRQVDLGMIGDGSASLLWTATFERGDLSEWLADGQGGNFAENTTLAPAPTTIVAHSGRYAGLITLSPSASMTSTNYLFRDQPSPSAAYYSAWFYVPSTITVSVWLSLTHFRGSMTGDGNNLYALWDVNLYPRVDGSLAAQLYDYTNQKNYRQPVPVTFPVDTWVQLEVYLAKATDASGEIAVWQDGTLIFDYTGATTTNDWIQWDAGGASDELTPSPAAVYLDDAAISTTRL